MGLDIPMGEPFPGETLIADGWIYKDLPKMLPALWDELMGVIGEGNYRLLTMAEYRRGDQTLVRGQILISPSGIANIRAQTTARREDAAEREIADQPGEARS